jgi:hypothetical protein
MREKALRHHSTMPFLGDAELKYTQFQPTLSMCDMDDSLASSSRNISRMMKSP